MTTKRVLIVDDSKTAQYRLKKMLGHYNLDIAAADSAEAALRHLARHLPDVIFMDHSMSGMDGLQALKIIKSHPATAPIPVIMYTSQSGDLYTRQAHNLGALGVVNKSTINIDDLRQILEDIDIVGDVPAPPKSATPPPMAVSETPDQTLAMELRLKALEDSIEANRRFVTSRLAREIQGVRHDVRKLMTELAEVRQGVQALSAPEATPSHEQPQPQTLPAGRRLWARVASLTLVALMGSAFFFYPP